MSLSLLRIFQWPLIALRIKTKAPSGLQATVHSVYFTYWIPVHLSDLTSLPWDTFTAPSFRTSELSKLSLLCDHHVIIDFPSAGLKNVSSVIPFCPLCLAQCLALSSHAKNFIGCMNESLRRLSDIYCPSDFSGEEIEVQRFRHLFMFA